MPLVQLTAYLAYVVIAVVGSFYVISGVIVLGQLQAFIQYIWQVSQPMGNITQLSGVLQSASASAKRVFEILDDETRIYGNSFFVTRSEEFFAGKYEV